MTDLYNLLRDTKLVNIESELKTQIDRLPIGYYDAKLAVMLSMLITQSMSKFDEIKGDDFPKKLQNKFLDIQKSYKEKVDRFRNHLEENAKIIRAIEAAETSYPDLENKIEALLSQYDELLKEKIQSRDGLPVANL